jgi:uncharacterized membrane protein YesL
MVLLGGIFGGLGGYMLEYWTQVIAWPMNIGGRPFHSWPHFIPVTFECTVLVALFSLLYAFPLAARYQNSIMKILSNSRQICIRFFIRTLVLLLLITLVILIILWNSTTEYFGLLIGPTFIMFTIASFSKRIFQKLEQKQE